MANSSFYFSQLADIQSDAAKDMMKTLISNGLTRGYEIKISKGTFKLSITQEQSGMKVLKIVYLEKKVIFNHRTINPTVLLELHEALESQSFS